MLPTKEILLKQIEDELLKESNSRSNPVLQTALTAIAKGKLHEWSLELNDQSLGPRKRSVIRATNETIISLVQMLANLT